jgi:hypothetical protein
MSDARRSTFTCSHSIVRNSLFQDLSGSIGIRTRRHSAPSVLRVNLFDRVLMNLIDLIPLALKFLSSRNSWPLLLTSMCPRSSQSDFSPIHFIHFPRTCRDMSSTYRRTRHDDSRSSELWSLIIFSVYSTCLLDISPVTHIRSARFRKILKFES